MKSDRCSIFKALSDPTRIKIIIMIRDGEMCVSDICRHFNMTQPSISHHLAILKNAGIVSSRKEGKEVMYSLDKCCIIGCCGDFMEQIEGKEKE